MISQKQVDSKRPSFWNSSMFVPEGRKANKEVPAGKAAGIPQYWDCIYVGCGSSMKCSLLGQGKIKQPL